MRSTHITVLLATLKEYFETTTRNISLPTTIHLKKGRYLLSAELESGPPIESLRVAKKTGAIDGGLERTAATL